MFHCRYFPFSNTGFLFSSKKLARETPQEQFGDGLEDEGDRIHRGPKPTVLTALANLFWTCATSYECLGAWPR